VLWIASVRKRQLTFSKQPLLIETLQNCQITRLLNELTAPANESRTLLVAESLCTNGRAVASCAKNVRDGGLSWLDQC